nr:MAG TPA: hypothetical protein [Caudoviricetes sp.]
MDELRENYWKVISRTRKSGKISQSVKERIEAQWKAYDEDIVKEALQIHISRYPEYKETYTIGIMRNLQKRKQSCVKPKNSFGMKEKQDYDFDELERLLLK